MPLLQETLNILLLYKVLPKVLLPEVPAPKEYIALQAFVLETSFPIVVILVP